MGAVGAALLVAIAAAFVPKPVPIDVATVARQSMRVTVNDDGRTRVRDRYVVSAPLQGNLARIELRAGDEVRAEAVLARIVPMSPPLLDAREKLETESRVLSAEAGQKQARANIARVKVAYDFAGDAAKRDTALAAKGAISAQALEQSQMEERARAEELSSAQFGEQIAEHQLTLARAALAQVRGQGREKGEHFIVPSPTGGRVLKVIQSSSGPVLAGTPLLEIGDPSKLEIVVDVLTADAVQIAPRARVSIDHWGGDAPLAGHVRLVEPSAFTRLSALGVEEQRVNVIIDLDAPRSDWAALGDGYRVDAGIVVWEKADALVAPAGAIFRRGAGWATYVASGGAAHLREVTLGKRSGSEVEVLKGLEAGAQVVLYPSDRVVDGAKVAVR